jgi:hypothetical protein
MGTRTSETPAEYVARIDRENAEWRAKLATMSDEWRAEFRATNEAFFARVNAKTPREAALAKIHDLMK